MQVGVIGAKGKMGQSICQAVRDAQDMQLVGEVDEGIDMAVLAQNSADVVVDVTNATAARMNLPWVALHGINAVVGTTGLDENDLAEIDNVFRQNGKSCFIIPNFSIGAILMMKFAEMAAPYFDGVEIIELHHNKKKDAPSGTAALTATRTSSARGDAPWLPDPTQTETAVGARGGEAAPGIRVHSVRLPGLLAHQEVIFGSDGQSLTIRHDSYDRSSFMPGVLKALRAVGQLSPGITVGLDEVM